MSSLNRVTLLGRLGADPELRNTQSGEPVCSLRLATSETWTDSNGDRQERTEWHSVVVFGKQAESCGRYLAKGRQALVEGRLQTREYTDREGINRKVWEVVASNVVFVGDAPRAGEASREAGPASGEQRRGNGPSGTPAETHADSQGTRRTGPQTASRTGPPPASGQRTEPRTQAHATGQRGDQRPASTGPAQALDDDRIPF